MTPRVNPNQPLNRKLPKRWRRAKLGDVILDMKDGGTPPRKNPENFGGGILWCVVKDIAPEITATRETLTEAGLGRCSAKIWPANSVIISLGATIGNVGIAKAPMSTKQGLSGIVCNPDVITPNYLYHVLRRVKPEIQAMASGVTIKEVRPSKLKEKLIFALPPLAEQKTIVAKLDKQLATVEQARQAATRQLVDINLLSTALVRTIFPAGKKLPKGWRHVKLGRVCQMEKQAVLPGTEKWSRLTYIGLENIEKVSGRIVNVSHGIKPNCVSFHFCDKHILYGKLRPYLNKVAVPDFEGICSTEAVPLLPNENLNRFYFACYLRQDKIAQEMMKHSTGSRQPRASMSRLLDMNIPLPSITEQERIMHRHSQQLAAVEAARAAAQTQLTDINHLTTALLREAIPT